MNNNKYDEMSCSFPAPTIIGNLGSIVSSNFFSSKKSSKS